jgi:hypothetical protein
MSPDDIEPLSPESPAAMWASWAFESTKLYALRNPVNDFYCTDEHGYWIVFANQQSAKEYSPGSNWLVVSVPQDDVPSVIRFGKIVIGRKSWMHEPWSDPDHLMDEPDKVYQLSPEDAAKIGVNTISAKDVMAAPGFESHYFGE